MQPNTATTSLDPAKMTPIVNRVGNPSITPVAPKPTAPNLTGYQAPDKGLMNTFAAAPKQTTAPTPAGAQTMTGAMPPKPTVPNKPPNYAVPLQPVPTNDYQGGDLRQNDFSGVTSDKQYQYDPRTESLVQNQIAGLMDPNSALMRKAIAQGNSMAASRGLQSSSIGQEIALSSMIDKALPIAQQDAQTYNQAQSQQWQTQAQLDQTNLKNQQDAQILDKQADYQNQMQDKQMQFQAGENNTNREFQQQQQDLQFKQNLAGMDKQAAIQTERDAILQQYNVQLNQLQNDQRWKELVTQIDANMVAQANQLNAQMRIEYGNSVGTAVNHAMQAIGMAMSNPNMTTAQQQAAVQQIISSLQSQTNIIATVFGATPPPPPPSGTGSLPSVPVGPPSGDTWKPGGAISNQVNEAITNISGSYGGGSVPSSGGLLGGSYGGGGGGGSQMPTYYPGNLEIPKALK